MGTTAATKAVRAVSEDRLVYDLEHVAQCTLHDLVLDRRDADRARLSLVFRDVHTPYRLMPIAFAAQPLVEVAKVRFQRRAIRFVRHPVDSYRRVLV